MPAWAWLACSASKRSACSSCSRAVNEDALAQRIQLRLHLVYWCARVDLTLQRAHRLLCFFIFSKTACARSDLVESFQRQSNRDRTGTATEAQRGRGRVRLGTRLPLDAVQAGRGAGHHRDAQQPHHQRSSPTSTLSTRDVGSSRIFHIVYFLFLLFVLWCVSAMRGAHAADISILIHHRPCAPWKLIVYMLYLRNEKRYQEQSDCYTTGPCQNLNIDGL